MSRVVKIKGKLLIKHKHLAEETIREVAINGVKVIDGAFVFEGYDYLDGQKKPQEIETLETRYNEKVELYEKELEEKMRLLEEQRKFEELKRLEEERARAEELAAIEEARAEERKQQAAERAQRAAARAEQQRQYEKELAKQQA